MNTHIPVLLNPILRVIKEYDLKGNIFDGTFGGGGYSLTLRDEGNRIYATDLDQNAIDRFNSNLDLNKTRIELFQANFANKIEEFDNDFFDAIVVDLGFSNNQLTVDSKGFSYQKHDQILDLRYDQEVGQSASRYLKSVNYFDLRTVLFNYSGETFASKIADTIINRRDSVDQIRVSDLVEWVTFSIPKKFINKKNQVLSRVWQALRIHLNNEFASLEKFLNIAPSKLKKGGLLFVVNFHSLEDKITTKKFRDLSKTFDKDSYGNKAQNYILITKKPIVPDQEELTFNPQSRSATLRILQKCQEEK
ncbi:MAG: 16S rRNA (cytosine(1402)-N(4))-methyltransferase RsmH [Patescibacteria group bacterium]